MSYLTYKNLHLIGVFFTLFSLGAYLSYAFNQGTQKPPQKKLFAMTHGLGMLLILLGGFGTLARLQIRWPLPGWVWAKLAIWILLGGAVAFIPRRPQRALWIWWGVLFLAAASSYLALQKPF